jgi:hypothetical protein
MHTQKSYAYVGRPPLTGTVPAGPARRDLILLLYAYPKNVSADLTPRQVAQLAKVVKEEFRDES